MRAAVPALLGSVIAVMVSMHRNQVLRRELAAADRVATTDSLTGIGDRTSLHREFEQLVVATEPDQSIGLLLLDLDGFKPINDRYGHATGDEVLRYVAERLVSYRLAGCTTFAARLGGDEFVLLICRDDQRDGLERAATDIATRCREPLTVGRAAVHVGVSIGVTYERAEQASLTELLAEADIAVYRAKCSHTDVCVYDCATDGTPD